METFNKVLKYVTPSVFVLEETKRNLTDPPLKVSNLNNYQVFELRREKERKDGGKGLEGGGIEIGVLHELNPVLTRQGDDEAECLSVEFSIAKQKFLCVAGYGPQMGDTRERKEKYWTYMDEEEKSAKKEGKGIIIQMDSNSWVGSNIIPGDPNQQNSNGKLMKTFWKKTLL